MSSASLKRIGRLPEANRSASPPMPSQHRRKTVTKTNPKGSKSLRQPKLARILVPTDFSRNAAHAFSYALAVARQFGGKITLVHVLDWPMIPATVGAAMTAETTITGDVKHELEKLAKASVPAELLEGTLVRVGRAHRDIVEVARGLRMDLIVLSTHGRTGLKRVLVGSTAELIVRNASCPVLIVRRVAERKSPDVKKASLAPRINRILVPVDFSARTKSTVQFASALAQSMQARLALVHIVAPMPIRYTRFRAEFKQHAAETKLDARNKLNVLAVTVPSSIKVDVLLREDIPHWGIVAAAKRWRSDLILLPTRGSRGMKDVLVGSTAEAVVRHAPCPVLTIGGDSTN